MRLMIEREIRSVRVWVMMGGISMLVIMLGFVVIEFVVPAVKKPVATHETQIGWE